MKKMHFFGLLTLAVVFALGMAFVACGDKTDSNKPNVLDGPDSIKLTGKFNGQNAELIISKTSRAATYGMADNDFYILRYYDGETPGAVISRGQIEWDDPKITFVPTDGSAGFTGYYYGTIVTVVGLSGWETEGTIYGGGGSSPTTPTTPPTSIPLFNSPTEAIGIMRGINPSTYTTWAQFTNAHTNIKKAQEYVQNLTEPDKSALQTEIDSAITDMQDAIQAAIEIEDIQTYATGILGSHPQDLFADNGEGGSIIYYVETPPTITVPTGAAWTVGTPSATSGAITIMITHPVGSLAGDAVSYPIFLFPTVQYEVEWGGGATTGVSIEYPNVPDPTVDFALDPHSPPSAPATTTYTTGNAIENDFYGANFFAGPTTITATGGNIEEFDGVDLTDSTYTKEVANLTAAIAAWTADPDGTFYVDDATNCTEIWIKNAKSQVYNIVVQ